jgi:hypothetical protein
MGGKHRRHVRRSQHGCRQSLFSPDDGFLHRICLD